MGNSASQSIVDCVCEGDIQTLRSLLQTKKQQQNLSSSSDTKNVSDSTALTEELALEIEEAVHTVVAMEIDSAQQFQQMLIALELLLPNHPDAWNTSTTNTSLWTACHRACVTGNLSFLPFVMQHYKQQFEKQGRDLYGLFPIDLVPPEVLRSSEDIAKDEQQQQQAQLYKCQEQQVSSPTASSIVPTIPMARTRRNVALQALRNSKQRVQAQEIRRFVNPSSSSLKANEADKDVEEPENGDVSYCMDYFLAFLPSNEYLSVERGHPLDFIHDRSLPLRLKYRLPRVEAVLHGYFQLIWRGIDKPRSEEPHYEQHVLMKDEMSLHPQTPLHLQLSEEYHEQQERPLEDSNPVIEGCCPFEIFHLPEDAVCHVLFVACDKYMMKRTILLSTEGIALRSRLFDDELEEYIEEDEDGDEADSTVGFSFNVAGQSFTHPNKAFEGKFFMDLDEFHTFVKDLGDLLKQKNQKDQKLENRQHIQLQVKDKSVDNNEISVQVRTVEPTESATESVSLVSNTNNQSDSSK